LEHSLLAMITMALNEPRRILIPTDFSACSELALDYAAMLGRCLGASVHVVYVSEVPKELIADWLGDREHFVDADIREGRTQMDRALARLREKGVARCTGDVVPGHAESVILELARSGKHDLVVIGTHGRTGFKRLWLGSVAERISRYSAVPVVMVRAPQAVAESA
jgi:nucleotide-binding universal stress UspA family protein